MPRTQAQNSHIRWLLIFWMFVVSAVAYLDRVNISIAAPTIAKEFALDNVQLGWVFSAFVLGYALFQAPGGWLADRMGPRKVIGIGVLWWAIFTTLITLLSPTSGGLLGMLILTRFLLGVGESVVYPACNCVVANWVPSTERGIANGIIFAGVGFGAGVTPPLITYLLITHGWRSSFWASAVLGLLAGFGWYAIARNTPKEHPWVSEAELTLIEQGLPGPKRTGREQQPHTERNSGAEGAVRRARVPQETTGSVNGRLSWSAILTNGDLWAVTFSYFCFGYAAYIFFSWFFTYLRTVRNLDIHQSSYYTMLPFVAMAIASPLGGWISDRLVKRRGKRVGRAYLAAVSIGFCAVFIALGTQVTNAKLASVVLAGGAGALYLSQSSFWSVSADIGRASAGSVSGVMNMGGQLGGALTASLTPLIARHFGWSASFMTAAALCAAGAVAWLFVQPQTFEPDVVAPANSLEAATQERV